MHRITHPTYTQQVLEVLSAADDFMTLRQVAERLNMTTRRASTALHNLYLAHAVDVVEGEDALWWFATPDDDRRSVRVRVRGEFSRDDRAGRRTSRRRRPTERPWREE